MRNITYLCLLFFTFFGFQSNASNSDEAYAEVQRVRITFTMPTGHIRHLLLGFTPDNAATDNVDYGYDAANVENFPNDLNWIIEDGRYVIQGVGEFNNSKFYELGMFLSDEGNISIGLHALENFDFGIEVYLYDALVNEHTLLNQLDFTGNFSPGTYTNRFYITFSTNSYPQALTVTEVDIQNLNFEYYRNNKLVEISNNGLTSVLIHRISFFDMSGKKVFTRKIKNSNSYIIEGINLPNQPLVCAINTNAGTLSKLILP